MDKPNFSIQSFFDKFPPLQTPLTLGENSHHSFSSLNEPLPHALTEQFILPHEEGQVDELTEFVPCFRIANAEPIIVLVYWKAGLLNYQYVMLTYSEKGQWIDRKVIGGTYSDGQTLTQSISIIDEDLSITIVSGQMEEGESLDPSKSTAYNLEILPNGTIVSQ